MFKTISINVQIITKDSETLIKFGNKEKLGGNESFDFSIKEINDINEKKNITEDDESVTVSIVSNTKFQANANKINVYGIDTIKDLKYKLENITGIPYHRQHLSLDDNALQYTVYRGNTKIPININNAFNPSDDIAMVGSMPILYKQIFEYKDNIRIKIDNKRLQDLDISGNFKLVDLDYFLSDTENLNEDTVLKNIVYYSFIMPLFPVISLEMFQFMLSGESNKILSIFPDLTENVEKSDRLISEINKHHTQIKKYHGELKSFIIKSVMKVATPIKCVIDTLELFNILELTTEYNTAKVNTSTKFKSIEIIKKYTIGCVNVNLENFYINNNNIVINVRNNNINYQVVISSSGNYILYTKWRYENKMTFSKIIKYISNTISDLITLINKSSAIKFGKLFLPTNKTTIFYDVSVNINYTQNLDNVSMKLITKTINGYIADRIMDPNTNKENISKTYYYRFKKSIVCYDLENMFQNTDITENEFLYLSNDALKEIYCTIVKNKALLSVTFEYGTIKFNLSNVSEEEHIIIVKFLASVIYDVITNKENISKSTIDLRRLKDVDPQLFSYSSIYKTGTPYSRLCQGDKQPNIFDPSTESKSKLKKLQEEGKIVKFYNVTEDTEQWYGCNKKYPYLRFITEKHPEGYCMPCCAKNSAIKTNKFKEYKTCLLENKYFDKSVGKITENYQKRYTISYREHILPGRVMFLPSTSLGLLIYENILLEEDRCRSKALMYVVGIKQHNPILTIIANMLQKTESDTLNKLISEIHTYPNKFQLLYNGGIYKHFLNSNDLLHYLKSSNLRKLNKNKISKLYEELSRVYLNIPIIKFIDNNCDGNVCVSVSPDIFDQYLTFGIIIKVQSAIYPIYQVNPEKYFSDMMIEKTLFTNNDKIIQLIMQMVDNYKVDSQEVKYDLRYYKNKCKVVKKYINSSGLCYAIDILTEDNDSGKNSNKTVITLPIIASDLQYNDKISIELKHPKWNSAVTNILKYVEVIKRVYVSNGQYCGVEDKYKLFYWFKPTKNKPAKFNNIEQYTLPVTPHAIKEEITKEDIIKPNNTKINKEVSKTLYDIYFYKIFRLHISHQLENVRNRSLRNKLISGASIDKILKNYPKDLNNIIKYGIYETQYNFDREIYLKIFNSDKISIKNYIEKIINKVSVIVPVVDINKFPSILTICKKNSSSYCKNNKLMITKSIKVHYINLLVSDIMNPLKKDYIVSKLYIDNVLNKFKFIIRPNEKIYII